MNVGGKRTMVGIAMSTLLLGGLVGCSDDSDKSASNSTSATATDSAAQEQDAVLRQEARWLAAITSGDKDTIESILSPNFKHISSDGKLFDRGQEMASIVPEPFTMNPTEQTVDIVGDTAVIHGVNTLVESGKVIARERFTDVFVKENGTWMALAAHETNY